MLPAGRLFVTKGLVLKVGYVSLAAGALIFIGLFWLTTIHP
jgi:hypothetical protein